MDLILVDKSSASAIACSKIDITDECFMVVDLIKYFASTPLLESGKYVHVPILCHYIYLRKANKAEMLYNIYFL